MWVEGHYCVGGIGEKKSKMWCFDGRQ